MKTPCFRLIFSLEISLRIFERNEGAFDPLNDLRTHEEKIANRKRIEKSRAIVTFR